MLLNDTFLDAPGTPLGSTPDASGVAWTVIDGTCFSGGSGVGAYGTFAGENMVVAPTSLWPTNPTHTASFTVAVFASGGGGAQMVRYTDPNNYMTVSYYGGQVYLQKCVAGTTTTVVQVAQAGVATGDLFAVVNTSSTIAVNYKGTQIIAPQTLTDSVLIGALGIGFRQYNVSSASTGVHITSMVVTQAAPALVSGTASGVSSGSTIASVTSTAASGGTSPYTYQWQRSTSSSSGFANVSGATSLTLNDTGLTNGTPYYYRLVSTDSASATVTGNVVTETPAAAPTPNFTLSATAPASAPQGSTTTSTVTLNATGGYTGTANLSATGLPTGVTAAFSPASETGGGTTSSILTFTVGSSVTAGTSTVTILGTDTPSSITRSTTVSLTITAGVTTIPVSTSGDTPSPYNWFPGSGSWMESVNPGAYRKGAFNGTSFGVAVNVAQYVAAGAQAASYPIIEYRIDNNTWAQRTLLSSDTTVALASGLTSGSHTFEVHFIFADVNLDRWNTPVASLRLASYVVDPGCTVSAHPQALGPTLLGLADSNGEGREIIAAGNAPASQNARLGYIARMGRALGCEYGAIAFSSQGYNAVGSGNVPAMSTAWSSYCSGKSRLTGGLLTPAPAWLISGHGENDGDTIPAGTVTGLIPQWRAAGGSAMKIGIMAPPTNPSLTASTAGVTAAGDPKSYFSTTGEIFVVKTQGSATYANSAYHMSQDGSSRFGSINAVNLSALAGGGVSGTYTAAANVRLGTDRGDGVIGTLIVPSAAVVLAGTIFDATTAGTVVLPPVTNVRLGSTFGPASASHGTLMLPPASDVEAGIGFGAGGSEFTGTLVVSGGGGISWSDLGAIEAGLTARQSFRKMVAYAGGYYDLTSVPGFVLFKLQDGTEAYRYPASGRTSITPGSGL